MRSNANFLGSSNTIRTCKKTWSTLAQVQCLVSWWHQAITWTNVYFSLVRCCGILKLIFCIISLRIFLLKLLPLLPGCNDVLKNGLKILLVVAKTSHIVYIYISIMSWRNCCLLHIQFFGKGNGPFYLGIFSIWFYKNSLVNISYMDNIKIVMWHIYICCYTQMGVIQFKNNISFYTILLLQVKVQFLKENYKSNHPFRMIIMWGIHMSYYNV